MMTPYIAERFPTAHKKIDFIVGNDIGNVITELRMTELGTRNSEYSEYPE